jgi:Putative zinc-finger
MEHAPLRPVPARLAGPLEPATAVRELSAWLPALPPTAVRALALVVLAERPRAEVAGTLGVSEAELGELLAAARKELRQTVVVLGGSGWCERAEGLISDRLDSALAERDVRRLDVHLRNCTRCVEHERRLVQATDALIGGVGGFARTPAPSAAEPPPLVEATPEDDSTEEGAPPADEASAGPAREDSAGAVDVEDARPGDAGPAEDQIAAAAEVLVAKRTRGQIAAAIAWNSLIALAILLTLATIAFTIAGILGAQL